MKRGVVASVILGAAVAVSAGSAASTAGITMPGKLYAPNQLDVLVGTTVTWQNTDRSTHTVTEDNDVFDSGNIRPGQTFSMIFEKSGTFRFHCTIHRFMRGSVSVFEVVLRGPSAPLPAGRRTRLVGIAPAGVGEIVLERVTPGPLEVVGRARPDPDGGFSFPLRAPEPRRYRARAGEAASAIVRVRVEPRVAAERIEGGIMVHAAPSRAGSRVTVQAYDRDHFAWATVARGRLDSRSSASIPYEPGAPEHVRAVVVGSQGWSSGASRPLLVRP